MAPIAEIQRLGGGWWTVETSVSDKCEGCVSDNYARQVWETSLGDKCE